MARPLITPKVRLLAVGDQLHRLGFRIEDEDCAHALVRGVDQSLGIHRNSVRADQLEGQLFDLDVVGRAWSPAKRSIHFCFGFSFFLEKRFGIDLLAGEQVNEPDARDGRRDSAIRFC